MNSNLKRIFAKLVNFVPISLLKRLPLGGSLALRRAINFAHSQRKIENASKFSVANFDGSRFYLTNDGSSVAQLVYFQGIKNYEPGELKLWQKLCSVSKSQIVEIGSNIGIFTIIGALAKPDSVVYDSFEPHPLSFKSLSANLLINKTLTNVNVHQLAVGSPSDGGVTRLMIPQQEENTQSTGAFILDVEQVNRSVCKSFDVRLVSADMLPCCDLLKIDAEGSEFKILNSMLGSIIATMPLIVVEVRRKTLNLRSLLCGLIRDHSYQAHAISPSGLRLVDSSLLMTIVLQDVFETRDLILIPSEKAPLYQELLNDYYL